MVAVMNEAMRVSNTDEYMTGLHNLHHLRKPAIDYLDNAFGDLSEWFYRPVPAGNPAPIVVTTGMYLSTLEPSMTMSFSFPDDAT